MAKCYVVVRTRAIIRTFLIPIDDHKSGKTAPNVCPPVLLLT